jgi:hypothetical protein
MGTDDHYRNDFFEPPQKFSSIEAGGGGGGGGGGGEWTLNGMALRLVGMAQLPEKCKEKFSLYYIFQVLASLPAKAC